MRFRFLPVAVLLAAAAPAAAQVTVNPKALEPLGGAASHPSQSPPNASGAAKRSSRHHTSTQHHPTTTGHHEPEKAEPPKGAKPAEQAKGAKPAEQAKGAKPAATVHGPVAAPAPHSLVHAPPVVPPAPPPVVTLAPLEPPPPAHPAPPPQPAPVVAGAGGEALPLPDGLRLTFGSGSTDMNPQTDAALHKLAHEAAGKPNATVTVTAYAAGESDDPSTPRRLSLSRALSARTVLISQGIDSTHIYLRALGSNADGGPPDRVDVTVNGPAAAKPEQ